MNKVFPFDVVIYHSPCNDGHAAAACLYMRFPNALFIGIRPGEVLLTEQRTSQLQGTRIVMVDVCIHVSEMNILSSIAAQVVVLDHHITNATLYENLTWPNVDLCFDMNSPGCWLAWYLVNGKETPLPKALYYIGLRDIWKHKDDPDAVYFTTAFECPKTWDEWIPYLIDDSNNLKIISKGRIIYEYEQSILRIMASKAEFTTWRGYRMSIVNVPFPWISDIGDLLCIDDNTIAVVWNKQVTGPFNVSLRSNGPDVAKIAAQFGGGGHAKAAGFRTEIPPYQLFNGASFDKCLERAISKSVDEMQEYAKDERCRPIYEALTSQDTPPLECIQKAHTRAKELEKNDFIAEYLKGLLILNVQNELGKNGFEMIKL